MYNILNFLLLFLITILITTKVKCIKQEVLDPVRDQIVLYSLETAGNITIATNSNGAPADCRDTTSLNKNLINDKLFMETITNINRQNIPKRFVHARGSGAFGYFEVTHDITNICRAEFLDTIGKKTPIAVRFSPVLGDTDTSRTPRGFAVKFYTKSGNFDIPGFDTPIFVVKDPIKFPSFVRSSARNPATNINDANAQWDFTVINKESLHIFLYVFGDSGIPKGYRHMRGYGIHTYQVHNKDGNVFYVRFHFTPDAGFSYLTSEQGQKLDAEDPDSFQRDLYEAIACGKVVSWVFSVQILTDDDAKNSDFDVFDATMKLPLNKYPLVPVGKIILNKNPLNYFAEIEQLAFCPSNLVRGIDGGIGKLYEARRFAYEDAQFYRLGGNKDKIGVNYPWRANVHTYNRDGRAPVRDNEKDAPNYFENSFNGPTFSYEPNRPDLLQVYEKPANNTAQVTETFNEMSKGEKKRLIDNIVSSLSPAIDVVQQRTVKVLTEVHPDLGNGVLQGLENSKKQQACDGLLS